jgi:hypothetical protein
LAKLAPPANIVNRVGKVNRTKRLADIALGAVDMRQTRNGAATLDAPRRLLLDGAFAQAHLARESIAIEHQLRGHPLLTLGAIADLADWLPPRSIICDTADQPLLVPTGGPPRGSEARPGDVIRHIDTRRSWLTLLNVEQQPAYRELMDACLDEVAAMVERRPGDTRRRAGFIFVSSPLSVTPAHFDIEHSLLLQISGHKQVTVGRFATAGTERRERERYWEGSHGRVEELPIAVATHDLIPGHGVYLPPVRPHWVHNGDAVSVSMTLTYFSRDSERDQFVEAFNARLRQLHLRPLPPGRSPAVDGAKVSAMRLWGMRHRLLGRQDRSSHY